MARRQRRHTKFRRPPEKEQHTATKYSFTPIVAPAKGRLRRRFIARGPISTKGFEPGRIAIVVLNLHARNALAAGAGDSRDPRGNRRHLPVSTRTPAKRRSGEASPAA